MFVDTPSAQVKCQKLVTELGIKKGILPGLITALKHADEMIGQGADAYYEDTKDMNLIFPVDGRMLKNILALNKTRLLKLEQEPVGDMREGIYQFSYASAVAMAERQHARFAEYTRHFVTFNNQVTTQDKEKLMFLLNRRTEELASMRRMAMSGFVAEQAKTIFGHRADVLEMAQAAASDSPGMNNFVGHSQSTTSTAEQDFYRAGGG